MIKTQFQRKMVMLKMMTIKGGWNRAKYLKKKKVFYSMGESCYYHPFRIPAEAHLVSIGDNVFLGTGVSLVTHNMVNCVFNNKNNGDRKLRPLTGKIVIGNNVFIGANATIMYGVTVGDNCIVAANAVVTKDIPNDVVVAGVPAKIIGTFSEQEQKCVLYNKEFNEVTKNIEGSLWEKQVEFFYTNFDN